MSWHHRPYDHRRRGDDYRNVQDHGNLGAERPFFGQTNNGHPGLLGDRPAEWSTLDRQNPLNQQSQHYEDRDRHHYDKDRRNYGHHSRSEHQNPHYVTNSSSSSHGSSHSPYDSRNFTRTGERQDRDRNHSSSRYNRDSSRDRTDSYSSHRNYKSHRSVTDHSQYDKEAGGGYRNKDRSRDRDRDYSPRYNESQSRDDDRKEKVVKVDRRNEVDRVDRRCDTNPDRVDRRYETDRVDRRLGENSQLVWETASGNNHGSTERESPSSTSQTRDDIQWETRLSAEPDPRRRDLIQVYTPYVRWLTTWRDSMKDYNTTWNQDKMNDLKAVEWLIGMYTKICDFSQEISIDVAVASLESCKAVVLRYPEHTEMLHQMDNENTFREQESARSPSPPLGTNTTTQSITMRKDFVNITRVIPTERSSTSDWATNPKPTVPERTIDWNNSRITIQQEPQPRVEIEPERPSIRFEDQYERRKPQPDPIEIQISQTNENPTVHLDWFTRRPPKHEQFLDNDMRRELPPASHNFNLHKEDDANVEASLNTRNHDEDLRNRILDVSSPGDFHETPRTPANEMLQLPKDHKRTGQNTSSADMFQQLRRPPIGSPCRPSHYPPIPPPIPPTFANSPMFNQFLPPVPPPPMPPMLNLPNQPQLMMGFTSQGTSLMSSPQMMPPNNYFVGARQPIGMSGNMRPDMNSQRMPHLYGWEPSEEDIMISRIKEKAAQSFGLRGKDTSRSNFSKDLSHKQQSSSDINKSALLDPRLKPRVPREIQIEVPPPIPVSVADSKVQNSKLPELKDPRTTATNSKLLVPSDEEETQKTEVEQEISGIPVKRGKLNEIRRDVETVLHPLGSKVKQTTTVDAEVVDKLVHASDKCKDKRISRTRTSVSSEESGKGEELPEKTTAEDSALTSSNSNLNLRRSPRKPSSSNEKKKPESPERRSKRIKTKPVTEDLTDDSLDDDNRAQDISEDGKSIDQKTEKSFRIPKLKRPEPSPAPIFSTPSPEVETETLVDEPDEPITHTNEVSEISVSEPSTSKRNSDEGSLETQASQLPTMVEDTSKPIITNCEVLRTVLLQTLPPDQVDIFMLNWDTVKDDVTAVIQAKLLAQSSTSVEPTEKPSPTTDSPPALERIRHVSSESREEDETHEEPTRGRSLTRKKCGKRRSSLEKLHDALREMKFDQIMPLGPRRTTVKQVEEQDINTKPPELVSAPKESIAKENDLFDGLFEIKKTSVKPKRKVGRGKRKKISPIQHGSTTENHTVSPSSSNTVPSEPRKKPLKRKAKLVQSSQSVAVSDQERRVTRSQVSTAQTTESVPSECAVADSGTESRVQDPYLSFNESFNSSTSCASDEVTPFPQITEKELQHSLKPVFELPMKDLDQIQFQPEDYDITEDDLNLDPSDFEISDIGANFMGRDEGLDNLLPPSLEPETFPSSSQANCDNRISFSENETVNSFDDFVPQAKEKVDSHNDYCNLCEYYGKKIVAHYSNNHQGATIPHSCLNGEMFESLKEINSHESEQLMEIQFSKLTDDRIFLCLFCDDRFLHMSEYCEHLSSHTGEFRYMCKICGMKYPFEPTVINHVKRHKCNSSVREMIETLYELPVTSDTQELCGYLCKQCNYFQLEVGNVSRHLEEYRHNVDGVICIKFQGPLYQPTPAAPRFDESVFLGTAAHSISTPDTLKLLNKVTESFTISTPVDHEEQKFYESWIESSPEIRQSTSKNLETDEDIMVSAVSTVDWLVEMVQLEENEEVSDLILDLKTSELSINLKKRKPGFNKTIQYSTKLQEDDSSSDDSSDSEEVNDFYEDSEMDLDSDTLIELEEENDSAVPIPNPEVNHENAIIVKPGNNLDPVSGNNLDPVLVETSNPVTVPEDLCENEGFDERMDVQLDAVEATDGERITNLDGPDLYRCGNEDCPEAFSDGSNFRDHQSVCSFALDSRNYFGCHHCEKKFKTVPALMEHIKIHGKPKQVCSLCNFRCWHNIDMNKHMKVEHKIYTTKMTKVEPIEFDSDILSIPMSSKLVDVIQLQRDHMLYAPKIEFLPNELENIPQQCIFNAPICCAKCEYSTKVRTNFIRHLKLHEEAEANGGQTQVPSRAPVNPAPCLTRKDLMFDKMINLAGSSHMNKNEGGKIDGSKLPQFVSEQFRYVCSVDNCQQITVDDSLLRIHMRVFHPEATFYKCPHCQLNEGTRDQPRHLVPVDRISTHLKLHGNRLFKCGHCDFIGIQKKLMDKHVADKHVEKKQIHFLIRDLDKDGKGSDRRNSTEENSTTEKWRCMLSTLCRGLFESWREVSSHCEYLHKVKGQFVCNLCRYTSDSIIDISNHVTNKTCSEKGDHTILTAFSRIESANQEDNVTSKIWRRDTPRVKHIRGIYLEESDAKKIETPLPRISNPTKLVQLKTKPSTPQKPKCSLAKPGSAMKQSLNSTMSVNPKGNTTQKKIAFPNSSSDNQGDQLVMPKLTLIRPINTYKPKVKRELKGLQGASCPLCGKYKTILRESMKVHLYNELQYLPYTCTQCGNRCVTVSSLKAHVELDHKVIFNEAAHSLAFQDSEMENRVERILRIEFDGCMKSKPGSSTQVRVTPKLTDHTQDQISSPPIFMKGIKTYMPSPTKMSHPPILEEQPPSGNVDIIDID